MMINAPFFSDIAQGPDGGSANWVKTNDGLNIRVGHWVPADRGAFDALKGTVLLFPGRSEYIEKYGPSAADFMSRGYATVAIDWRGQGLSDKTTDNPLLGDVFDFKDYQRDVAAFMGHVSGLDLPKPYFLVAHSMGGCIGLRALIEGLPVKAVSFSAPMWGISMAAPMRPLAWGISGMSRKMGFEQSLAPGQSAQSYISRVAFAENTLTSDRDMFDFMRGQLDAHPELELGGPSLRWLNESLHEMRRLKEATSPELPCLTFLGTNEAIVDPAAIRSRMGNWPMGALQLLTAGRHEVMMETPVMRTEVFDAMTEYFDRHR
ncbi:MAG: alpha/beta hydrolase [Yoonia sp.]|nr:alpha/beta hydrolase [Yoonia sp.]